MWVFRTIVLVPRPTLVGSAPFLILLFVYLGFQGWEGTLWGRPVAPLSVAFASGFFTLLLRNTVFQLCGLDLDFRDSATWVGMALGYATILPILAISLMLPPEALQKGYTVYLLTFASITMAIVRFRPEIIHTLPSIWATDDPAAPQAMQMVALGTVLRAGGAWWLGLFGSELLWVLFVSLGGLLIFFLTNWVTVLYLYLRETGR